MMFADQRPERLSLNGQGDLVISWNDQTTRVYKVSQLRDHCPCATCREKRGTAPTAGKLPILPIEEARPLQIVAMAPVGRYAYNITFSDGHDSGIFTLEQLYSLGELTD